MTANVAIWADVKLKESVLVSESKLLRRSISARAKRVGFIATSGMAALALTVGLQSNIAAAHGDVTPQAVDASKLKVLGKEWLDTNPYRGDKAAVETAPSGMIECFIESVGADTD